MPKRLTRLKINEVSAVDRGAGEGVRVVLMKKDGEKGRKPHFTDADELVVDKWDVLDKDGDVVGTFSSKKKAKRERDRLMRRDSSLAKAMAEIADHRRFKAALTEDTIMFTDIQKAAATTVVERFNARCEAIAKRDGVSVAAAMMRVSGASYLVNPEDASLWNGYRAAAEVMKADHVAPAPDPVPTVSAAYGELQKRAAELRSHNPNLSEASAFAKAYADNRDLAEQDRAFHFAKAAGGVDPNAALVQALVASLGIDENHARGIMLELRAAAVDVDAHDARRPVTRSRAR